MGVADAGVVGVLVGIIGEGIFQQEVAEGGILGTVFEET
jgi:hypothetical protein